MALWGALFILGDLTFDYNAYLCWMKTTILPNSLDLLSLFLPSGCLDYFDVTNYSNMDTCYIISLEEKNIIPSEYADLSLVSKGFHPEIQIQDFPARGKAVYLHIKRHRWEDKAIGKTYSRDWNLVATGTRITAEFGSFLKELLRNS